jgi:pseudouridine-5'-phosphate glycosidase
VLNNRSVLCGFESLTFEVGHVACCRTAKAVEAVVRQHGATPATVAVVRGKLCVGK